MNTLFLRIHNSYTKYFFLLNSEGVSSFLMANQHTGGHSAPQMLKKFRVNDDPSLKDEHWPSQPKVLTAVVWRQKPDNFFQNLENLNLPPSQTPSSPNVHSVSQHWWGEQLHSSRHRARDILSWRKLSCLSYSTGPKVLLTRRDSWTKLLHMECCTNTEEVMQKSTELMLVAWGKLMTMWHLAVWIH